jgi:hypothetical protein
MRQPACEGCGAGITSDAAVCARCGATGPSPLADRLTASPYGPPVIRLHPTQYGPPALASAHDALQPETQRRAAAGPNGGLASERTPEWPY